MRFVVSKKGQFFSPDLLIASAIFLFTLAFFAKVFHFVTAVLTSSMIRSAFLFSILAISM